MHTSYCTKCSSTSSVCLMVLLKQRRVSIHLSMYRHVLHHDTHIWRDKVSMAGRCTASPSHTLINSFVVLMLWSTACTRRNVNGKGARRMHGCAYIRHGVHGHLLGRHVLQRDVRELPNYLY